ncbi:MAG: 3-hydroxyacyl-CoA dehydrogenase NAD-binding domain-containing protein [Solirubrobacterales bacterium]
MESKTVRFELGDDGVLVLTFDDPERSANMLSAAHVDSMDAVLAAIEERSAAIRGIVLSSAKPTFFAGADLNELIAVRPGDPTGFGRQVERIKAQLRRLETLRVPVVAALGGAALGGGLEIALASHHRIALVDRRVRFGFPEVTLGLLPGAGGVVRSVRMLGVEAALDRLLLSGDRLTAAEAAGLGIVDQVVDSPDELMAAARAWIDSAPDARQPWDRDGYELPGGSANQLEATGRLAALSARLAKRFRTSRDPAPATILAAAVEGAHVDFQTALDIEGRYFMELASGQVAKNMIRSTFFDLREVRRQRSDGTEPFAPRRAVVLGAGMMGAGIAHSCASAGIDVVLKDLDLEAAIRGKAHSERLVAGAVERGRMSDAAGEELLARIVPSADPADADGAELLIEAVFENSDLKAKVYAEIEPHLAPDALFGSNTSTLPITGLAETVGRPQDFIGLHFFSPVHRMELLEIVRGAETSQRTVERSLDVARLIGKTPIVVKDSRGFFTSRVIITFIGEGIAMLGEGIAPASIEQASVQAGYPAAVLQLADELNLKLLRRIRDESRAAREAVGDVWVPHPADAVVDRMLDEFGRSGRLEGAGFYEYVDGRRTGLWPGLAEAFGADATVADLDELADRMLVREAVEAARTHEEGVIESVASANVGSLLGIGFPAWTGGVLQFIAAFPGGEEAFVARARQLASTYGERFEPPASLTG